MSHNQKAQECWLDGPMTFKHQYELACAEEQRRSGDRLAAMDNYDRAIARAQANGDVQAAAIANELAAKFYLDWGKEKIASVYMQAAYDGYTHLGNKVKVDALETHYPSLLQSIPQQANRIFPMAMLNRIAPLNLSIHCANRRSSASTLPSKVTFDLVAIWEAIQTLSESIDLSELLEKLAKIMLQTAGAERLALLLPDASGSWHIRCTATCDSMELVSVSLLETLSLPVQLIQYVQHSQEILVVDAANQSLPLVDPYLQQHPNCSVLCMPLQHQTKLVGLLYLEHSSFTAVFSYDLITILNFLCAQAALSLENARLFNEQQRLAIDSQISNSFLKSQQDSSLDGMLIIDASRRVNAYNRPFVSIWKIPDCILKTKDDRQLLDHVLEQLENPAEFLERVEYLYANPDEYSYDEIHLKDQRILERYSSPVKLESGEYAGRIWYFRDISDRKSTEQQLHQLSERLELAIDSAQIGIWDWSREDNHLSWNQRMFEIYGLRREDFKGTYKDWVNCVHPEDLAQYEAGIRVRTSNQEKEYSQEFRIIRPDNTLRYIYATGLIERDAQGQPMRMVGTNLDITDRKQAELALQDAQAQFHRMTENVPGMIYRYVLHPDGHQELSYVSPVVREIYELEPEVVLDNADHLRERIHPDDRGQTDAICRESAETLQPFKLEHRLILPGQRIRWIQAIARPERLDNGDIVWDGLALDISDRKAAEASLRDSEAKFRTLLSNLDGAVYRCKNDINWTMEFISDAIFSLSGYPAADFIGNQERTYASIIHPDDVEFVEQSLADCLVNSQSFSVEYRIIHRDGSIRWVAEQGKSIFNSTDQHQYLEGVIFDISDRKRIEATIKRQLQREQLLTEITNEIRQNIEPARIFQTTVAVVGKAFEVNRCVIYTYRSTPEAHLLVMAEYAEGVTALQDLVFPMDHHSDLCSVSELGPIKTPHLPIMVQSSPTVNQMAEHNDTRQCQEAVVVVKNSQIQLILAQDHAFAVADLCATPSLPPMPSIAETAGTRALLLVRTSYQGHVNGMISLHQAHHCREWTPDEINLLEAVAAQVGIALAQAELLEQEKTQRCDLEIAKNAAEAANTAKSQFLANMSHELRTPLNAVLGFSELMRRDDSISQTHKENLDIINRSGAHLLSLINDILDMSKIDTGHISLTLNTVNLHQFLDDLQQMLQLKADAKQVRLIVTYEPHIPQYIRVDESKLRQALLNLLENAIKFTQAGQVSLTTTVQSELVSQRQDNIIGLRFTVTDTGPGVNPEESDTIFQPFSQGRTGKSTQSGSGLGLAISQKFAQLMGGNITLSSSIGEGSSFHCDILVEHLEAPENPSFQVPRTEGNVTGIVGHHPLYRLLVVDDNDDSRLLLCRMLSIPGFEIRDAQDGRQATVIQSEWHPHLIFMDIRMPDMDGLEATRQIRTLQSQHAPKIIALTANAFAEDCQTALATGCDAFIAKPYSSSEIFGCVAQLLNIQFSYTLNISPHRGIERLTLAELTAAINVGIKVMSADWQARLIAEVKALRSERIEALLVDVPAGHESMKVAILNLIDEFSYDVLLEILET